MLQQTFRDRLRAVRRADDGLTIVELVIAMSIFTIVLIIFFGALISMSQTTSQAQQRVDASNAVRAAFTTMDRQVRYASSINRPVESGSGKWYVEFELTELPDDQDPLCYQWQFDDDAGTISYRTWREDGVSSVSDWVGVAWDVGSTDGGSPFTFVAAGDGRLRQTLSIRLNVLSTSGEQLTELSTEFVARNSSSGSDTNVDADSDGISDSQVCLTGMDRP